MCNIYFNFCLFFAFLYHLIKRVETLEYFSIKKKKKRTEYERENLSSVYFPNDMHIDSPLKIKHANRYGINNSIKYLYSQQVIHCIHC